jgi:hypothetical protein
MIAKVYVDFELIISYENLNGDVKIELIASMLPFPRP